MITRIQSGSRPVNVISLPSIFKISSQGNQSTRQTARLANTLSERTKRERFHRNSGDNPNKIAKKNKITKLVFDPESSTSSTDPRAASQQNNLDSSFFRA